MRLGNRELKVIQNTLQLKSKVVPLNKTWQMLNSELQIGIAVARELHLTDSDLGMLKTLYAKHVKAEPETIYSKNADRMDLTDYRKDEKSGELNVFGQLLVFASRSAPLPLLSSDVQISYPGLVSTIPIEQVAIEKIAKLVVLENGTMLTRLFDWIDQLPMEWQDSLFIYRGHLQNCRDLNLLLERLPTSTAVAVYGDLDPSGLNIVASLNSIRPVNVIVPECWQSITSNHLDNNIFKHNDQIATCRDLGNAGGIPDQLKTLFNHLKVNQIAIMQENVNRLGKLECIALD
jgi:hypothetical protein